MVGLAPTTDEMSRGMQRRKYWQILFLVCISCSAMAWAQERIPTRDEKATGQWFTPELIEAATALCADENISELVWVDGQLQPSCAHAFGDGELREQNRLDRLQRILRIRTMGRSTDIVYQDSKLRKPLVRSLEGIRIEKVEEAHVVTLACDAFPASPGEEDDVEEVTALQSRLGPPALETIAWASLGPPFDAHCGAGVYPLRRDDALGAEGQVVHLGHTGALTLYRGDLLWVPYIGEHKSPPIRMIWRSDFQVVYEDKSKRSRAPAAKKKRGKKKRRR